MEQKKIAEEDQTTLAEFTVITAIACTPLRSVPYINSSESNYSDLWKLNLV